MVVLIVRDAASFPGSTQRWVAGIRGQMRASDLAGMLGEGEIGLLMQDTEAEQAKGIAERLRAVVSGEPGREAILVGVAGRTPSHGTAEGIVHDARADAVAGTRRRRAADSPHGVNR
jgi:GGDEF domain-containing protein